MVYNVLPLWSPPGQTEPFISRHEWPRHGSCEELVSDPANALGALAGKAHLKYVEVKAVVGGVTAIQGYRLAWVDWRQPSVTRFELVAVVRKRLFVASNVREQRRCSGAHRLSVRRTRRLKRRSKPFCVRVVKIRTLPRYRYQRYRQRTRHRKLVRLTLRHARRSCLGRRWKRWVSALTT
jgi:hypothetical protein